AGVVVGHLAGVVAGAAEVAGSDGGVGRRAAAGLLVRLGFTAQGVQQGQLTFPVRQRQHALADTHRVEEGIADFDLGVNQRVADGVNVVLLSHLGPLQAEKRTIMRLVMSVAKPPIEFIYTPRMPKKARRSFLSKSLILKLAVVTLVVMLAGLAWLDARVRNRFDSHQWQLPARVYARPVELYTGRVLSQRHVDQLLSLLRYREQAGAPTPGAYSRSGGNYLIHTRSFHDSAGGEPARQIRLRLADGQISALTSGDGGRLPVARLEPMQIGSIHPGHREDRILVRLADTPPMLHDMLLATEDRQFYAHHGLSFRGLA